jgi:hypothetical protein
MDTTQPAVLSTSAQINAMRAHMLRIGLEYEIRNPKMRLTSKTHKCYTIIKRELGFKGNKMKVYAQYVLWMEEKGLLTITPADRAQLMALAL